MYTFNITGARDAILQTVREKGVEPQWVGPDVAQGNRACLYVLNNFDCPEFKTLSGQYRYRTVQVYMHTTAHQGCVCVCVCVCNIYYN